MNRTAREVRYCRMPLSRSASRSCLMCLKSRRLRVQLNQMCAAFSPILAPQVVQSLGDLKHGDWRAFKNDRRHADARNFVDGDLVESFMDLPDAKMKEVVQFLRDDGWDSTNMPRTKYQKDEARRASEEGKEEKLCSAVGSFTTSGGGEAADVGPDAVAVSQKREITAEDVVLRVEELMRRH